MTPDALAALHARCFAETPRPWSVEEFARLLELPSTLAAVRAEGFALGRTAGPEAELLTLAVVPEARGCGVGRTLVAAYEAAALARGAEESFLEVAETNAPARALYARLGYRPAGRRPAYYTRRDAPPIAALVLRKPLSGPRPNA